MHLARDLARSLVRRGARTVLLTYPSIRLGNYLYFLLHAHAMQRRGLDYRVLRSDGIAPWLESLPTLRDYLVDPHEVRPWDRREHIPQGFLQAFGEDYTRADLEAFVAEVLLQAPLFAGWADRSQALRKEGVLTVNVRRGDYYERDDFREIYGFDVASYLRDAVTWADREHGRFRRAHVVSDGVEWCRKNLHWLEEYADAVTFVSTRETPSEHLVDLALSPALVLANSTFSFWGAYVSNVVHGDNHSSVWAPRFFGRGLYTADGSAWQLDPRWRVVENVTTARDAGPTG